ncbi:MAG: LysR family transcriptional regulator [Clostridiales bacterium]|nr:LysR family transcriptional regulator [Clostridiales bacterium]
MELKELEYVITIAKEGSISKAAERLYMAQSSLSQFLARYEAELNTKIFVRTSSGVRPTYAGEIFIRNAQQMLQQYHRVKAELQENNRPKGGRIEFGISTFRGTSLIPPVLRRFSLEYPDVEVVIHEHDSIYLQRKMSLGELDMALIALQPGETEPEDIPVMQDEVYLVASKSHPVMEYVQIGNGGPDRPWVRMEDTAAFEYLLSDQYTVLGNIAQSLLQAHGIQPVIVNRMLSASFAAAMARQGLGLAFTYRSCAVSDPNTVYLSIGKEQYFVDLVLIYPPDGYRSRANRALEAMIRQYIDREDEELDRLPQNI